MSQWSQVAARADRAARGHAGKDATVETVDQELDGRRPGAGVPFRERVRAKQHRGPDDVVRVGLADTARVAAQEAELELLDLGPAGIVWGDEAAEAGVDAVGVLVSIATSSTSARAASICWVAAADRPIGTRSTATRQTS